MQVVFFDGECNLCNSSIQYILKRDKKKIFHFSSLQSDYGQEFLKGKKLNTSDFDTMILYIPKEGYYTKSTAVLKIISRFNPFSRFLTNLALLLPKSFRDFIYEYISKHRYSMFGKTNTCLLPSKEYDGRFL